MLAACVAYGALLAFVYFTLRWEADYHWWGTVLLYTPRWFWTVPLIPLSTACGALRQRRWLWTLAGLALGACLVLDVEIPWRRLIPEPMPRQTLRILTCNCDYGRLNLEKMRKVIEDFDPDVVALQSVKSRDFAALFSPQIWYVQNNWRVGLASRYPIRSSEMLDRMELAEDGVSLDDFRRYELEIDGETLHLANVHLASPRVGLWAVITEFWKGAPELNQRTKMRRLEAAAIREWMAPYPDAIIVGDFNTPLESPTFRDNFSHYQDAFSAAGWGIGNTFQPVWWQGLRIDHILAGSGWWCRRCWVGPEIGPEHRAVMAELAR
ncbi:MAG TPA: endonuclease/exonuclease/phosphatase family protein [Pirellulales bacterium]|jgi:endonuclease/exonuclease/phosphatase family metal-dependent hydrolase|nr:endonuclease/exonuclease/phosphatase family protein [Pirellulales bacterium]